MFGQSRNLICIPTACFAVAAILLMGLESSADAGELNLLVWEGYTDPSFTSTFEERTGCNVTGTFVGSADEFPAKLAAGGGSIYDIISPSVDVTSVLVKLDVIEPLDTSRLEHWDEIYESFRKHPGVKIDGGAWGMPYTWGSIPLMYRTDKVDEAPTSYAVLWDSKYKGKTSIQDDKTNLAPVARLIYGRDFDAYDMTDEQLAAVRDKLIEQKQYLRKYWASAGELVNLYASGEVWISTTWGGYQVALLREEGIPVEEVLPIEKGEGWQDVLQIVKNSANMDCAYAWLNYSSSNEGQCGVMDVTGYWGANPEAMSTCRSDEDLKAIAEDIKNLSFAREPGRPNEYIATWNAIKAGQ